MDIITYTPDSKLFLAEVEATFPDKVIFDESAIAVGVTITKTPTIRNGNATLAVVRCTSEELSMIKSLTTITILSEGPDLLNSMSVDNRALYDSVHDCTPVIVLDENGVEMTITKPELIGGFA